MFFAVDIFAFWIVFCAVVFVHLLVAVDYAKFHSAADMVFARTFWKIAAEKTSSLFAMVTNSLALAVHAFAEPANDTFF